VREIFHRFTELVEPLSLDEAYLDVTHHREEGVLVASRIRSQIEVETGLSASAGIAPNKLLAKIASDWNKPDGQFEIRPGEIEEFLEHLPVKRLYGVGRKMEDKLAAIEVVTCGDLQRISKLELAERFGNWGMELYELCRGRDERAVKPNRIRKSVSNETTLREDIGEFPPLVGIMEELRARVAATVSSEHPNRVIKSLVVKLKFSDFTTTTAERAPDLVETGRGIDQVMDAERYRELLAEAWGRGNGRAVRLIGVGVRFADLESKAQMQLNL
jgi:DNA polymerase-4